LENIGNTFFKKRTRAFALVSVMILVSLLGVMILEFSRKSGINLKLAVNYANSKKALYAAYSAYQAALALLMEDSNDYDGPGDVWYGDLPPIPFDAGTLHVKIEDEKARFNLQELINQYGQEDARRKVMLERMFRVLSIDTSIIGGIVDWQDKDKYPSSGGAEIQFYQGFSPPYNPPDQPLITVGDILLVKGFDRKLYFLPPSSRSLTASDELLSLDQYVTVFGDGLININTAPLPVLVSLSQDINEDIAMDIIKYREENPFHSVEEIKQVGNISDVLFDEINSLVTVKSNIFRIRATGMVGEVVQIISCVVLRQSRGFRVVYFNRSL